MPIVGRYGNFMRFFGDSVGTLLAISRKYDNIAALCRDRPEFVCVFGVENNRRVLSDGATFPNYAKLPFRVPENTAFWRLINNLMFKVGDDHRRLRRLLVPAFQRSKVEAHRETIVSLTERLLPSLFPEGRMIDVARAITELTLTVTMACFFGLDVSKTADEHGRRSRAMLDRVHSPAVMLLPIDLPGTPYAKMLRTAEEVERWFLEVIRERQKSQAQRDVLSLLIAARDDDGGRLTDLEIATEMNLLFVAGHGSQADTIAWTLFLLSQHPRVLADLEDELKSVLRGDAPHPDHFEKLTLLDAVIKETMRLFPATPFLAPRRAACDVELGGIKLPESAGVLVSPFITHRMPHLYPEPDRFLPERWSRIHPTIYEFLPFGAGLRTCIGASLASMMMRILIPMLITRYRFSLEPLARVSRVTRGITLGLKHGLSMRIERNKGTIPRRSAFVLGDVHDLVDLH
jgi:cytochrome P450